MWIDCRVLSEIFYLLSREDLYSHTRYSVNRLEWILWAVGCCSPLHLAVWNFSLTLPREHGGKGVWDKEETCAVILVYETFPEVGNITLHEYRNKGFKMSKTKKKYRRAWEFQISIIWEWALIFLTGFLIISSEFFWGLVYSLANFLGTLLLKNNWNL